MAAGRSAGSKEEVAAKGSRKRAAAEGEEPLAEQEPEPKRPKGAKRSKPEEAVAVEDAGVAGEVADVPPRKANRQAAAPEAEAADAEEAPEKPRKAKAGKAGKAGRDEAAEAAEAADAPASEEDDAAYRARLQISTGKGGDAGALPPCFRAFAQAPFAKKVKEALAAAGFVAPTPIQAQCWPVALQGSDLIAVAKTGSGKTLGFLLPVSHLLGKEPTAAASSGPPAPRALVLAPTRELAMQIQTQCEQFCSPMGCHSVCVYGGAPVGQQKKALKEIRPSVVIATPGRLVDLLEQGALVLKSATRVVMDEADRMLDMGFEPQINSILEALPEERQTLFFTATWPKTVRKLAATFLRSADTVRVFIGAGEDAELEANKAVTQTFIQATDDEKQNKLHHMLWNLAEGSRAVIFANTKRRVENLCKFFWAEGFGVCAIHGDKKQFERDQALAQFVKSECPFMFATDVAARGLDIKGVTHVINFDMARDVESYVHRIGRTGRAGELGESITFWNPDYDKECAPALVKIARDAGQEIPAWLAKFESAKASKLWKVEAAVLR